jgi:predicted SAM-dependent methyltransferase
MSLQTITTTTGNKYLNIGCGNTFSNEWTNIDLSSQPGVQFWDIRKPLPFANNLFDAVYTSHVLEHLIPEIGHKLVEEIFRILKPNGIFRLVVPDLENICREYLHLLELCLNSPTTENKQKYNWILLELFDQMIRTQSGGMMAEMMRRNDIDHAYLKSRQPELYNLFFPDNSTTMSKHLPDTLPSFFSRIRSKSLTQLIQISLQKFTSLFRSHDNPEKSGEIHKWMYDRFSLHQLLIRNGFRNFEVKDFNQSSIMDWQRYQLDTLHNKSTPRKPDSIYVEAFK